MKILNLNKIDSAYPKRCTCENCGAELEYDKEDEFTGIFGINFVLCPNCNNDIDVTNANTKRTIKMIWNKTFAHTFSDNSVEVSDDDIQKMIDRVYNGLKDENDGYFYTISTGDTLVIGLKNPDSTTVYVTKDYYEDVIYKN